MPLQTPPLRGLHDERGAKFTEFGGWDMPVEFDSIQTEHAAVRDDVGIFDVSHMGQLHVTGPDATALMQRLTSNDVSRLTVGDSQYAAITDEDGIIIDDTVVYRLPDEGETPAASRGDGDAVDGEATYLFVPNAGTDEDTHERWLSYRNEWDLEATVDDRDPAGAFAGHQGCHVLDTGICGDRGGVLGQQRQLVLVRAFDERLPSDEPAELLALVGSLDYRNRGKLTLLEVFEDVIPRTWQLDGHDVRSRRHGVSDIHSGGISQSHLQRPNLPHLSSSGFFRPSNAKNPTHSTIQLLSNSYGMG